MTFFVTEDCDVFCGPLKLCASEPTADVALAISIWVRSVDTVNPLDWLWIDWLLVLVSAERVIGPATLRLLPVALVDAIVPEVIASPPPTVTL